MSGLIGSLEAISTEYNHIDTKDIRRGIKGCMSSANKIAEAERIKLEHDKMKESEKTIDAKSLTTKIREDMGENVTRNNDEIER